MSTKTQKINNIAEFISKYAQDSDAKKSWLDANEKAPSEINIQRHNAMAMKLIGDIYKQDTGVMDGQNGNPFESFFSEADSYVSVYATLNDIHQVAHIHGNGEERHDMISSIGDMLDKILASEIQTTTESMDSFINESSNPLDALLDVMKHIKHLLSAQSEKHIAEAMASFQAKLILVAHKHNIHPSDIAEKLGEE